MNEPLPASPFVVRAPEARAMRDARAILADAQAEASRIRADAQAERVAVLAAARAEGLAQAAAETAPLATATAAAAAEFWSDREAELRDLALAMAYRILSRLPAADLLIELARDAITEHARDTRLALRVAPDLLPAFRTALDRQPFGDHVTVTGDPDLTPGECALIHPRGRTDLGLLSQFRAMMSAASGRGEGA